jgi:hypothetical protein
MNLRKFFSGVRSSAPDTEAFRAMLEFSEEALPKAAQLGELTPETLEYCQGIIALTIQGKRVAKTRIQWAEYLIGLTRIDTDKLFSLGCPFRSYDSKKTMTKKLRKALLQLESFTKVDHEATLDELVKKINKDCRGRISVRRLAKNNRRTGILGG